MAATVTYASLVTTIKDYLERNDAHLVDQIPLFIMMGQRRIAHDLKIVGLKVYIAGVMSPGINMIQKPSQWLNNASFMMGTNIEGQTNFQTRVQILERAYEFGRMYWPDPTLTAPPKYYADYDFYNWIVFPTPDQAYPCEIGYYQTPTLIDETTQTTWVTQNIPELLIYACLLETASYLKDDERVAVWTNYYNVAQQAITQEDHLRILDNFSTRKG